jgi:hypothetical protein
MPVAVMPASAVLAVATRSRAATARVSSMCVGGPCDTSSRAMKGGDGAPASPGQADGERDEDEDPGAGQAATADGAVRRARHAVLLRCRSVHLLVFAPAAPGDWSQGTDHASHHEQASMICRYIACDTATPTTTGSANAQQGKGCLTRHQTPDISLKPPSQRQGPRHPGVTGNGRWHPVAAATTCRRRWCPSWVAAGRDHGGPPAGTPPTIPGHRQAADPGRDARREDWNPQPPDPSAGA